MTKLDRLGVLPVERPPGYQLHQYQILGARNRNAHPVQLRPRAPGDNIELESRSSHEEINLCSRHPKAEKRVTICPLANRRAGKADSAFPGEADETVQIGAGQERDEIHVGCRPRFAQKPRRDPADDHVPDPARIEEPENRPEIRLGRQAVSPSGIARPVRDGRAFWTLATGASEAGAGRALLATGASEAGAGRALLAMGTGRALPSRGRPGPSSGGEVSSRARHPSPGTIEPASLTLYRAGMETSRRPAMISA